LNQKVWKFMGLTAILFAAGWLAASQAHRRPVRATSSSSTEEKISHYVRARFNVPAATKLTVLPLKPSQFAGFYETTIVVDDGHHPKSAQQALVTKDGRYLIFGQVYSLDTDPATQVARSVSLADQPSIGPPNAPVTIIEYADLECPTCGLLQKVIEDNILPKYGNKIRIVFKDFPLFQIHDWAMTAAIASQCAYEIDPTAFFKFRSTVFANQSLINAANVRTMLLDFGERNGIDRLKLSSCIDSRASLGRVESDLKEGNELSIASTPSCFINGRLVVGANPQDYYNAIDEALRKAGR
jgi:protein-disulfide isomerase